MKKNIKNAGVALALIGAVLVSACSNQGSGTGTDGKAGEPAEVKPKKPITLTIFTNGVTAAEFDDRFRGMLQEKFPHVTIEYIQAAKGSTIVDLVAQNKIPDIIRTDIPTLYNGYLDYKIGYDLSELIKKNKYDLNRFNKVFMDEIVTVGRTGAIYGLPVPPYFPQVLYYNKDLFDKFGVPYPKDGMTWDEVYELAKKLSRTEGSTVYRGFSANTTAMLRDNPFSHPILDPNADQLSDMEKWKTLFTNFKRFYEIPNNAIEKTAAAENTAFSKGKVAMMVNQHSVYLTIPPEVNWDIVSYPLQTGAPKLMPQRGSAYWSITNTSQHKDEAFEIITAMLSDEMQMSDSRKGLPTTLTKKEVMDELGKGHPVYSKKNMNAINLYPPVTFTPKRKADLIDIPGITQQDWMAETFVKVAGSGADMNTALRELDERLKAELAKLKSQK
ncbi:ABC transporter substrate-binding protein [Paenibacillus hodogayensis]|uniref:ABC transporter substrate-binding protein n=1 Tax=Paenibacillus hodogayensis TaxID=279208 RepID=A0ABV5W1W1_9BACL